MLLNPTMDPDCYVTLLFIVNWILKASCLLIGITWNWHCLINIVNVWLEGELPYAYCSCTCMQLRLLNLHSHTVLNAECSWFDLWRERGALYTLQRSVHGKFSCIVMTCPLTPLLSEHIVKCHCHCNCWLLTYKHCWYMSPPCHFNSIPHQKNTAFY